MVFKEGDVPVLTCLGQISAIGLVGIALQLARFDKAEAGGVVHA